MHVPINFCCRHGILFVTTDQTDDYEVKLNYRVNNITFILIMPHTLQINNFYQARCLLFVNNNLLIHLRQVTTTYQVDKVVLVFFFLYKLKT